MTFWLLGFNILLVHYCTKKKKKTIVRTIAVIISYILTVLVKIRLTMVRTVVCLYSSGSTYNSFWITDEYKMFYLIQTLWRHNFSSQLITWLKLHHTESLYCILHSHVPIYLYQHEASEIIFYVIKSVFITNSLEDD